MNCRWLALPLTLLLLFCESLPTATETDPTREALQRLNDFIGEWKGTGSPDKLRPDPRDGWKESISWSWKFSRENAWLVFTIKDGKYWHSGEIRYLPAKRAYELMIEDLKKQKHTYLGRRDDKGYLTFERNDSASGDTQQIIMNSAGDGARFVYRYAVKPKDRTIFNKIYQVAATKEGEALAAKPGSSGPECIVTGGKGTIAVSYQGKTYYVCCTGCRDAFNENPENYINQAQNKK